MSKHIIQKLSIKIISFSFILFLGSCEINNKNNILSIEVTNSSNIRRSDVLVELNKPEFILSLNKFEEANIGVSTNNENIPFQLIRSSSTGLIEKMLVLCDFDAEEKLQLNIIGNSDETQVVFKRTQAELSIKEGGSWTKVKKNSGIKQYEYQGGKFKNVEYLRVPDKHSDNSLFIRYEGPGWESDKIAYRYYIDWRNAVDIFGKKTSEMVLQNIGLDGFGSYHENRTWGMDVLKVGSSLGLGSIGYWDGQNANRITITDSINCRIQENGNIRSAITTNYFGWKDSGTNIDLESRISINAGSRLTYENIKLSRIISNICTGIVKHDSAHMFQSNAMDGDWAYMATFGKQSVNMDKLGMFIFYKKSRLVKITEDPNSYVVVLLPENKKIDYYFGAVWEEDLDKISTKQQFVSYLNTTLNNLNSPIIINK